MVEWDTLYTLQQFSYWLRHTVEKVLNRLELIPAINYCCARLTSSSLNLPFEICAALQWIQVWFTSITILDLLKIELGQFVLALPIASDLTSYLFWKTLPILVGSKVEQNTPFMNHNISHWYWLHIDFDLSTYFGPSLVAKLHFFSLTTKYFWTERPRWVNILQ